MSLLRKHKVLRSPFLGGLGNHCQQLAVGLLLTLLALILSACEPVSSPDQPASNREMAATLAALLHQQNHDSAVFSPERMAEYLTTLPVPGSKRQQAALSARKGRAWLLSGYTELALQEFETAMEIVETDPTVFRRNFRNGLLDWLAITQLRLGEQINCVGDHNAESCLLPLRGGGIHRSKFSAQAAYDLYLKILQNRPQDLQARWLLNIAAMALGEYPNKIPDAFLIAESLFIAEDTAPKFHDIAPQLKMEALGLSGGVVMDDFDRDGRLDILSSSWGLGDPLRLWLNQGDGRFTEKTEQWGLKGITGGLNLVQGDYDNDGFLDVLVLRGAWQGAAGQHPNSLLRNRTGQGFEDVSVHAGVTDPFPSQTAAWGDFDNDGLLDLFVGIESSGNLRQACRLYRNLGNGQFRDVALEVNANIEGYVKAAVWGDYNNDGRIDLYISLLNGANQLLHNLGPDSDGRWRFVNKAVELGVSEPINSFPAWFWDYDNDGWLDIFVSGYPPDIMRAQGTESIADSLGLPTTAPRIHLYRNLQGQGFANVAPSLNLDRVVLAMGANFGDIDNDGFQDLYLGTGTPDLRAIVPNVMFRNDRGERFQNVTSVAAVGHIQKGHGIAFGDIDNDGDQDIYADLGGAFSGDRYQNAMFINSGTSHQWLTLRLIGKDANRSAIGARIKIETLGPDGSQSIQSLVSSGGSFGASSLQQEIGLGDAEKITRLEVRWPGSGKIQYFSNLMSNRLYTITEGEDQLKAQILKPIALPN